MPQTKLVTVNQFDVWTKLANAISIPDQTNSDSKQTHAGISIPRSFNQYFTSIQSHLYARTKNLNMWQPTSYLCLLYQMSWSCHTVHNFTVKYIYSVIYIYTQVNHARLIHSSINHKSFRWILERRRKWTTHLEFF